jgi:hypothetical protein
VALGKRQFDHRHDEVLREIFSYLCTNLPCLHPQFKATADLATVGYSFPVHLYPTDERPDIVLWKDDTKEVILIELTVCFQENFADASQRKLNRYHELVSNMRDAGVRPKMGAIQVGSRGMIDDQSFEPIYRLVIVHLSDP